MKTLRCLINDIKKYRKYIIYSARVALQAEVTNAYLDWFWWILEPVCSMLIYFIIFGYVFKNTEQYYLVFIYSALTMWFFFSRTINASVKLIKASKGIITKVYIPKTVILLSNMLIFLFKMFISSIVVVVLMMPYRVSIDYHLLGLIPVLGVFFIFCYGIGCYLMHIGVFIEDMSYVIDILLQMLFYFTGIFYSVGKSFPAPLGQIFETVNPLAFFIAQMRNALMYKTDISLKGLAVWFGISVLLAINGSCIVYKNENTYVKVI